MLRTQVDMSALYPTAIFWMKTKYACNQDSLLANTPEVVRILPMSPALSFPSRPLACCRRPTSRPPWSCCRASPSLPDTQSNPAPKNYRQTPRPCRATNAKLREGSAKLARNERANLPPKHSFEINYKYNQYIIILQPRIQKTGPAGAPPGPAERHRLALTEKLPPWLPSSHCRT